MKLLRKLLLLVALGTFSQANGQLYTFQNFNHRDGLHTVSINCVDQSDDGYLWIGTEGTPLVRFDGKEFVEVRVKGQDFEHHITHIDYFQDTVFFASQYKGFFGYARKTKSYFHFPLEGSRSGDALALINTTFGRFGISSKKIYQLTKGKTTAIHAFNTNIELYHHLVLDDLILLFTSEGNYVLRQESVEALHETLNSSKTDVDKFRFGHLVRDKLLLCNESGTEWLQLVISSSGKFIQQGRFKSVRKLQPDEIIVSYHPDDDNQHVVALSNRGELYKIINEQLHLVPHNYTESITGAEDIFIDLNGDYWVSSSLSGLYKVSLEAFTKIRLHPIYESSEIIFPYMTSKGDVIMSLLDGTTHVGNFSKADFDVFDFMTLGATQSGNDLLLATNKGVKRIVYSDDQISFENILFANEKINFIQAERDYIWIGVAGKGLYRTHKKAMNPVPIRLANSKDTPKYFYTAQISGNGKKLYFGTNDGILFLEKKSKTLQRLVLKKKLGSYSGVSTKDVYGTLWFTLNKGIVGITERGEIRLIEGEDYFETNLFYTLCADRLGNLVIGTNRGIRILKVDKNGSIVSNTHYDASSGFGGYETHMRSQYVNDNNIFVGTVEGLFLINTDILDQLKVPIRPVIRRMNNGQTLDSPKENSSFYFKFNVNNPQSGKIQYQYRLLNTNDESWKEVASGELSLFDLPSGNYVLEVRATYDGQNFSPTSREELVVPGHFWNSAWIVLGVILIIGLLNYYLVRYSRKMDKGSLIRTQDMNIHSSMAPMIILLGILATTASHITGPLLNNELTMNLSSLIVLVVVLTGLYFMTKAVSQTKRKHLVNRLLLAAIGAVLFHLYYESYVSNLHPFHLVGIAITCIIVPYFIHGVRSMIVFTSFLTFGAVLLLILVDQPVYPKPYVGIAFAILIVLLLFSSFLRANSLERLLFISGIINRGNIPAIAFNSKGTIIYASENIDRFIDTTHEELIHKNISSLNKFVPYDGTYKNVDVLKDFVDGNNYVVPLLDKNGKIQWIDWQYKEFDNDTKIMLGQEISEKMDLENTYELLVQNAEDFIYRCDVNGKVVFVNDTIYNRLGYSRAELAGKDTLEVVPETYRDEIRTFYRDHFTQRKTTSYKEFPIQTKDGETIWIGQHVTTLFAPGSTLYINGFIALARDITALRRQQKLIKDQRDDITSSINYAQRIQFNLLPHERYFNAGFLDHFIIYKPRDIVSGDFYWMERIGDTTVLALADCTGHGVPGAFMTLLGINLLNSIVKENRILDPGKILDELDKRLVDILPRSADMNSLNDGMEITICAIQDDDQTMSYGCAGSRFLIYSNDSFTMLKGDNKHIGDTAHKDFKGYSTHYTDLDSNDLVYLFSDGLQDQFGGEMDKKFTFRRVLSLLEENTSLPLPDQRVTIEKEINEWIGRREQTDDITLLSIRKKIN
jgi:PAS domain S-box-containing protein